MSDFGPGKLVPLTKKPVSDFTASLVEIMDSEIVFDEVSRATQDPRMNPNQWSGILRAELRQLFAWTVQRLSASMNDDNRIECPNPISSVLSLLPRYGIALHVLRRAAGFAGLGIPTRCGFHDPTPEIKNVVDTVARSLGISSTLSTLDCNPVDASLYLDAANTTCLVTGHVATFRNVEESGKWQRVIGGTGRCCVVLGHDIDSIRRLANIIEINQHEPSCARLGAVLLASSLCRTTDFLVQDNGGFHQIDGSLLDCLSNLHPSVIVTPQLSPGTEQPTQIEGYRLYHCDENGKPANPIGFGADPVCGWPGDYSI